MSQIPSSVDEYIAAFPQEVQEILQEVRATAKAAAPEATEAIKYAMPALVLHGNLVYYAGFKKHIGFYALPEGNIEFQKELKQYKTGKGSIQFPLDKPIPYDLITKIVQFRVVQQLRQQEEKAKPKRSPK